MVSICNDAALAGILSVVKRILLLIQIIAPILLIIMGIVDLTKLVKDPDDKKIPKSLKNKLNAAVILFMIPVIINAFMGMLGEKTTFSNCWVLANETVKYSNNYIEIDKSKNKTILVDPSSYEKGKPKDTSSTGAALNSKSCGTLEYCNKYLSSLFNNSQKLNDAIIKNNASVVYSNSGDPTSWEEAIRVAQSGRTVNIKLTAEAAVNDDYAVQLGWTLDTLANKRKTEVEHNTRVTGLDDNPPHDGTGDGYNVSGFNLVIYRDQQAGGGYHYREEVELDISGSVPCFHYDAE